MKRLLLFLVFLFIVAYAGLCWFFSAKVVEPWVRDDATVKELMFARAGIDIDTFRTKLPATSEDFEVQSRADGVKIAGSYFPQDTSRCAIIISHGYGSTRLSMMKYAHIFYDCGCDVLVYDHRGHGQSEWTLNTGGIREGKDILTLTDWLMERSGLDRASIGWMGESWGGSAVLHAGAADEDVAFVIAESAFQDWETAVFERAVLQYGEVINWFRTPVWSLASWRIGEDAYAASPVKAAEKINEPTLIIHSKTDQETASYQSVNIAAALPKATSRFHHLDWGAAHGNSVFERPEEFQELLFDFIQDFVPAWKDKISCLSEESQLQESLSE